MKHTTAQRSVSDLPDNLLYGGTKSRIIQEPCLVVPLNACEELSYHISFLCHVNIITRQRVSTH
jgi:hypothetical protein